MKLISELLQSISPLTIHGTTDQEVSSIEHDSRKCTVNSLFIAIRGTTTNDGHNFIEQAIQNGARTIVCEVLPNILNEQLTFIQVADSRESAALLSNSFFDYPSKSLRIIGVTGTNGKTTVTYLLKQLLEFSGEKIGLIGTTGNMIGNTLVPTNYTTPEAPELHKLLAQMRDKCITTVVMEVSSHALELKRVLGIHFSAALFTNLTHDHLDFHGSMNKYAEAKQMLFDSLDETCIAIFNGDSEFSKVLSQHTKANIFFSGRNENSDFLITDETFTTTTTQFSLNTTQYSTPLLGKFNIDNISLCIGLCVLWGMQTTDIGHILETINGAPGRMERIQVNGRVAVIDYAHTPDALENTLSTCRELLQSNQKLTVIFGCGGNRDTSKRAKMGKIAEQYADTIILTNDNPRMESPDSIINDILSGIYYKDAVSINPDRAKAIETGILNSGETDIIVIAGKGHETYQIIGNEKYYFSDKDEVLKYLQ
ncbi:MAG: UDP-N-acetylmuramoyl-L-alanyl-D-glutamate--2,6-diaminopimelate ligase [Bacteroidetes bacterium]|nr:UDP-N-acetylmuramoyl-L-alanyl-D-glutamate--2,6-diaminopimelate ligase [Bacteroidota bacterium]